MVRKNIDKSNLNNNNKIKIKDVNRIDLNDIIKDNNPLIREISFDVSFPLSKEDKLIMNKMIDYVRSSVDEEELKNRKLRPSYGISAIQIGYAKKMLFARIENEFTGKYEEFALINPKIINQSSKMSYLSTGEGCLSVDRSHEGYVLRNYEIKLIAIDYFTDREIEIEAKGLTSIVLQHEMDHLKGILFYDRINRFEPFKIQKNAIKI